MDLKKYCFLYKFINITIIPMTETHDIYKADNAKLTQATIQFYIVMKYLVSLVSQLVDQLSMI